MAQRISTAVLVLGVASSLFLLIGGGRAGETHVDCDKVMHEIVNGKSAQEVANDLDISASAVYDCKNAKAAAVRRGIPSPVPSVGISTSSNFTSLALAVVFAIIVGELPALRLKLLLMGPQ